MADEAIAPVPDNTDAPGTGDSILTVDTPVEKPEETDGSILTTGEEAKPEEKPAETAVNELAGAPQTYDEFKMPEGVTLDGDSKAKAVDLFKELNLSQKGAQKLIDAYLAQTTAQKEVYLRELAEQRKKGREAIRNRPTFAADVALARKGLNAVATEPEEKALFNSTWLSDHPAVFSMFVKVGKLLAEDTPIATGDRNAVPKDTPQDRFPIKL